MESSTTIPNEKAAGLAITTMNLESYALCGRLRCAPHPIFKHLKIYNYTDKVQYRKQWDSITLSCRGLVLDTSTPEGTIVARPMVKFFDYPQAVIKEESGTFSILEKADGSLCIFFHYRGEWHMATRGSFISPQSKFGLEIATEKNLQAKCDKSKTYCFEVIHPENKIRVDYGDRRDLVLLAVVDTATGFDAPNRDLPAVAEKLGVSVVKSYTFDGMTPEEMARLDIQNEEGFVIRYDNTGERYKVKLDNYLFIIKAKGENSTNHIIDLLARNSAEEAESKLAALPDEVYTEVKEVVDTFNSEKRRKAEEFDRLVEMYKGEELESLPEEVKSAGSLMKYLRMIFEGERDAKKLEEAKESHVKEAATEAMRRMLEVREDNGNPGGKKGKKKKMKPLTNFL